MQPSTCSWRRLPVAFVAASAALLSQHGTLAARILHNSDYCVLGVPGPNLTGLRDPPLIRMMQWGEMDSCLNSLTISAELIYETLAHLKHGLVDIYSFEGIASDSTNSHARITAGCKMPIHNVQVNLQQELQEMKLEMMASLGLADFEEFLSDANKHRTLPARRFHERLAGLFRRLNDAHTAYYVPWMGNIAAYFYVKKLSYLQELDWSRGARVNIQLRLQHQTPTTGQSKEHPRVDMREVYRAAGESALEPGPWQEVTQLGGRDAFDFLVTEADGLGNYKSHGARLNKLINTWSTGLFSGMHPLPERGSLDYTLADGSVGTLHALVMSVNIHSRTSFQRHIHSNPNWERIEKFLVQYLRDDEQSPKSPEKQIFLAQGLHGSSSVLAARGSYHKLRRQHQNSRHHAQLTMPTGLSSAAATGQLDIGQQPPDEPSVLDVWDNGLTAGTATPSAVTAAAAAEAPKGPEVWAMPRSSASSSSNGKGTRSKSASNSFTSATQKQQHEQSFSAQFSLSEAEEIGRFPRYGAKPIFISYRVPGSVVLKVTGFMPAPRMGLSMDLVSALRDLIKLYTLTVQEALSQGTDRLILDLADNGGGVVEMANLLTLLVAPRHGNNTELCAEYGLQMHNFWKKWLRSFGGGYDEAFLDQASVQDLELRLRRLRSLQELVPATNGAPLPVQISEIDDSLSRAAHAGTDKRKRSILKRALLSNEVVFYHRLMGSNTSQGWFPLTGDVMRPDSGEPFDPPLAPYSNPDAWQWGDSQNRDYSKHYIFACQLPFTPGATLALWGVGASIEKSKHQWKEIAILTNGLCGSACSLIASQLQFNEGATVFTYGGIPGRLMDSSAFAGGNVEDYRNFWPKVLYAALVGDAVNSPDTEIGRMLRAPGAKERSYARSLLLPLPTRALARFNFNMMFVPKLGPDALPREWYIMPGHRHYWEWHATDPRKPETWGELGDLYARIAAEDWAQVRAQSADSLLHQGVAYGCAAEPPTIPFTRGLDWDIYVYPPLILLLICCTGCWFVIWRFGVC